MCPFKTSVHELRQEAETARMGATGDVIAGLSGIITVCDQAYVSYDWPHTDGRMDCGAADEVWQCASEFRASRRCIGSGRDGMRRR